METIMAKTQIIGCKLPHGIILKDMNDRDVVINGMNTARIMGGFGLTTLDESVAAYLFATYADFAPFKANAIFTAESPKVADIMAAGRDLAGERTGFEGVDPDKPAPGMTPDTNVDKAREDAERSGRPVKAAATAADNALAAEVAGA